MVGANLDFGIAADLFNGDFILFAGACAHLELGGELDLDLVIGAWTDLSNIPGWSYAVGGKIEVEIGVGFDIVSNSKGVIGGTISIGAGAGFDVGGATCCAVCGYFGSHKDFCNAPQCNQLF